MKDWIKVVGIAGGALAIGAAALLVARSVRRSDAEAGPSAPSDARNADDDELRELLGGSSSDEDASSSDSPAAVAAAGAGNSSDSAPAATGATGGTAATGALSSRTPRSSRQLRSEPAAESARSAARAPQSAVPADEAHEESSEAVSSPAARATPIGSAPRSSRTTYSRRTGSSRRRQSRRSAPRSATPYPAYVVAAGGAGGPAIAAEQEVAAAAVATAATGAADDVLAAVPPDQRWAVQVAAADLALRQRLWSPSLAYGPGWAGEGVVDTSLIGGTPGFAPLPVLVAAFLVVLVIVYVLALLVGGGSGDGAGGGDALSTLFAPMCVAGVALLITGQSRAQQGAIGAAPSASGGGVPNASASGTPLPPMYAARAPRTPGDGTRPTSSGGDDGEPAAYASGDESESGRSDNGSGESSGGVGAARPVPRPGVLAAPRARTAHGAITPGAGRTEAPPSPSSVPRAEASHTTRANRGGSSGDQQGPDRSSPEEGEVEGKPIAGESSPRNADEDGGGGGGESSGAMMSPTSRSAKLEEEQESLLKRIDDMHESDEFRASHDLAAGSLKALPKHATKARAALLWRLSRSLVSQSGKLEQRGLAGAELTKQREKMVRGAVARAKAAIDLDDESAGAHKWYAISLGFMALYGPTKEQITNAFVIRDHAMTAARLDPSDPYVHHTLGQWCESVAGISRVMRWAAAALFATPPESTWQEAYDHYLRAEKTKEGFWIRNQVKLGAMSIKLGRVGEARTWLNKALAFDGIPSDDVDENTKEAEELLRSL